MRLRSDPRSDAVRVDALFAALLHLFRKRADRCDDSFSGWRFSGRSGLLQRHGSSGPANRPPAEPTLNGPSDGTANASISPTLDATVSDPDGDPLTVTFYGRVKAAPPPFTVVVIPDTQYYVADPTQSATFGAQIQWVVDTKDALNTVFVTHLGDIVEHKDRVEQEWIDAAKYMATLDDNDVKNNVAPGNHDMNSKNRRDV